MVFSPNESIIPETKDLWLQGAAGDLRSSLACLRAGEGRTSVLLSGYAVERTVKYILQSEGRLYDDDKTHMVIHLARRISFFDEAPKPVVEALLAFSNTHLESGYPLSEAKFAAVNDPSYARQMYKHARRAMGWLLERHAREEGGSDGSDEPR